MNNTISLYKTVYTPSEYPALRELFNRLLQLHQSQIVLKKK